MCVCEGVGKGVVGVITLPTSGVIDFGTHAFQSVHRLAIVNRSLFPIQQNFSAKKCRPTARFSTSRRVEPNSRLSFDVNLFTESAVQHAPTSCNKSDGAFIIVAHTVVHCVSKNVPFLYF